MIKRQAKLYESIELINELTFNNEIELKKIKLKIQKRLQILILIKIKNHRLLEV